MAQSNANTGAALRQRLGQIALVERTRPDLAARVLPRSAPVQPSENRGPARSLYPNLPSANLKGN